MLSNYKPFSSDPGCSSDTGEAFARGCHENGAGDADRGKGHTEGCFSLCHPPVLIASSLDRIFNGQMEQHKDVRCQHLLVGVHALQ